MPATATRQVQLGRLIRLHDYQLALQKWHRGSVRGGKRPSVASANKKVAEILRGQHMKSLFVVTVSERPDGLPALRYRFNRPAYEKLQRTQLGITILFTDNAEWTDEQIVTPALYLRRHLFQPPRDESGAAARLQQRGDPDDVARHGAATEPAAEQVVAPVHDHTVRAAAPGLDQQLQRTAGECYAIYHAAYRVKSDRLSELVACWNRLAPEDPSARLAFAEQQVYLGNHRLALRIVESIRPDSLADWQQNWAGHVRDAARRRAAEASEPATGK